MVFPQDYADTDELHFEGTVTFTEVDANRTTVTLRLLAPSAAAVTEMKKFGAVEGAQQNLARFGELLSHPLPAGALNQESEAAQVGFAQHPALARIREWFVRRVQLSTSRLWKAL
ncbi:MAG: SRPBCC family protein [Gemmatimonadaceae bacterium]